MVISTGMGTSAIATNPPMQARQATPEANEPMRGPDNDGDRDDHMASQSIKSTPAVNAMGETIGKLIDISA
ncbi:MAG: hypothetical protein ACK2T3_11730 [Candidatus Promineifilaceae bacterium]